MFVCVVVLVLVPRVARRACSCWGLVCSGWVVPVLLLVFGACCVRYSATSWLFVCVKPCHYGRAVHVAMQGSQGLVGYLTQRGCANKMDENMDACSCTYKESNVGDVVTTCILQIKLGAFFPKARFSGSDERNRHVPVQWSQQTCQAVLLCCLACNSHVPATCA